MDRVRASREDDDSWAEFSYGFERGSAGDAEREDREAPDSAGDKVGVLRAVVEDED